MKIKKGIVEKRKRGEWEGSGGKRRKRRRGRIMKRKGRNYGGGRKEMGREEKEREGGIR